MKNYDLNIWKGVHTVEITIQYGCYFGHIKQEVRGNIKGIDIIHFFDFEEDKPEDSQNDCELSYDEDNEVYHAVLKDEEGNNLEINGDAEEFNNMIVKIEILDFRKDETS